MASDTMTWLEEVLKAERKSVEMTLAQRHAALLQELAPMLAAKSSSNGDVPQGGVPKSDTPMNKAQGDEAPEDPVAQEDMPAFESQPYELQKYAPGWKGQLQYMLEAYSAFDSFIGVIIIVNSICIGWETTYDLEGKSIFTFQVLEHIFLILYIIELALRLLAYGWRKCLANPWVVFDMLLVLLGAVALYIVAPIAQSGAGSGSGNNSEIAALMVLRMLRLFRLVKLVRMIQEFKTLWQLIAGLVGSVGTICYTLVLIGFILYIFSCLSLEVITKNHRHSDNPDVHALVNTHFTNLQVTMLSLSQFVTVDGLSEYIFPLVMEDPKLLLFFLPFVLVVSISLMNLVTAVIVEGAIAQSKQDQEVKKQHARRQFKRMLPGLKRRFHEMDRDGNALLTLDEVLNARQDIKEDLEQFVDPENLEDLFEMIDIDDDGEINCDEFCDGLFKLVSSESPVELIRILKQLKLIRKEFLELRSGHWLTEGTPANRKMVRKGSKTSPSFHSP